VGDKAIHKPLVLAVEVLSPSTRSVDMVLKRSLYEESGVESYWLVDPDEPSILALELQDGRYVEVANAHGPKAVEIERPYPVRLRPSDLVNG
jgi:Uma2 family endonuclease